MRRLVDLGIAGALAALAVATWENPGARDADKPDPPGWATYEDTLIEGYDAGLWAQQVIAIRNDRPEYLDPHRAPTWTLLTLMAQPAADGDVARAGHLSNHLLRVILGPLGYLAARGLGVGRWAAALAAAAALLHPEMRFNAATFGVDMSTSVAWVALLAAVLHVDGKPWRAALAGVVTSLVFATHITTMWCMLPAALVLSQNPKRTIACLAAWAGSILLIGAGIYAALPAFELSMLLRSVFIGVVDTTRHADASATERLLAVLTTAADTAMPALGRWIDMQLGSFWPSLLLVPLLIFGLRAPEVPARPDALSWLARHAPRALRLPADSLVRGASLGAAAFAILAPLPVYFIVGASLRYANTLIPVLLILAARGADGLGVAADAPLQNVPMLGRIGVMRLLLPMLVLAPVMRGWTLERRGDRDRAEAIVETAAFISERWPGDDIATSLHEISATAGTVACPRSFCPNGDDENSLRVCLKDIQRNCKGEAKTVPYVIVEQQPDDVRTPWRRAMDDKLLATNEPLATFSSFGVKMTVLAVPRGYQQP